MKRPTGMLVAPGAAGLLACAEEQAAAPVLPPAWRPYSGTGLSSRFRQRSAKLVRVWRTPGRR